jgi:hypothetical protein
MTTTIIDPRSMATASRSNPFPPLPGGSCITIDGVPFVVVVEIICVGCTEHRPQSPCLSRPICDVCTRSVVQPEPKTLHLFTTPGGGEKQKSKDNDDDGYPPSVLETRLASDRHLPPFRLQYHVCLPTSEDPWFVHQPAGQAVVVSLVVVCGRKSSER